MIVVAQFSIFEQVCCGLARGEVALQDTFEDGFSCQAWAANLRSPRGGIAWDSAQRHHRQFVREFGVRLATLCGLVASFAPMRTVAVRGRK